MLASRSLTETRQAPALDALSRKLLREELERRPRLGLLLAGEIDTLLGQEARVSAATCSGSLVGHFVESSRIREPSG